MVEGVSSGKIKSMSSRIVIGCVGINKDNAMKRDIKVGDMIYIQGSCSISNGSSDVAGGQAIISKITTRISGGEKCRFVELKGIPGHSYNWDQYLAKEQERLKADYGDKQAHPDPDIDTPWIEDGDIVDGKVYRGKPIW